MSLNTISFDLADIYTRAMHDAAPSDRAGVRRAFRRAYRAAVEGGDIRPAILLSYRYP